ncbi:MAG: DUF5668 domain-containing protein [Acidobacteriia bacterium]|nr:DUF5668 domain-containing protein [Terriglobia bacterium]
MNCAIHTETPATAYCRTCGKAMCDSCKRDVMGAIYCEPCLAARLQSGAGAPVMPVGMPVSGGPNPAVAAWLGMIPGVGAMYNGQFVKAFIHVVIFGGLIAANEHGGAADTLFGLLTGFFWFYMVFDAYKTAKARQLGQPAPDMLGLDRMFGIQESQAGDAGAAVPSNAPSDTVPKGAVILIALGVIFLMGNFGVFRMLHLGQFWPVLLIGLGLWIAYRRTAPTA